MDIRIVTQAGGYEPNEPNLDRYRDELDKSVNAFLEPEKGEAGALLDRLSENVGQDPQRVQEGIDALFQGQRPNLRESLMRDFPRLSGTEIDHYLDEWQSAWGEHFNAEACAAKASPSASPEIFGAAPPHDPKLDTALDQANAWLSSLSGSQDLGAIHLANALKNEINTLINSGGTIADLQAWTKAQYAAPGADFIFATTTYAGVVEADITQWFTISQVKPSEFPTFSQIDDYESQMMTGYYQGTFADPDVPLATVVVLDTVYEQAKKSGKPIDYADLRNRLQQAFINGTFGGHTIMLSHPDQIYNYMKLFGLQMNYSLSIAEVQAQPPSQFYSDILNQMQTLNSQGKPYSAFVDWVNTLSSQDMYWKYPGLSQQDADILFQVAGIGPSAPGPTPMDTLLGQAAVWLTLFPPGSPDATLAQDLIKEIQDLGKGGNPSDLAAWAQNFIANSSDFTNASLVAQAEFIAMTGVNATLVTALEAAENWQSTTTGPAHDLATKLVNEIESLLASGKTMDDLQTWVAQTFTNATYDVYWQYPGLSQSDVDQLYGICHVDVPGKTSMDDIYINALGWLNTLPKPSADATLVQDLINEGLLPLGSAKENVFKLTAWAQNFIETSSDFTNASLEVQVRFLVVTGADSTLAPSLAAAADWQNATSGPAHVLATRLVNEIESLLKSGKTKEDLQGWLADTFTNAKYDVYWQYLGMPQSDVDSLYGICGVPVPGPKPLDTIYANVTNWLGTLAPGSLDAALAQTLVDELNNNLGSQKTQDDLTAWFNTTFTTQDIYMQNPDVQIGTIIQFYALSGVTRPPETIPMDTQFKLAYDWMNGLNPTSADYKLAKDLVAEMRGLGSGGDFAAVTAWAQGIVNGGFSTYGSVSDGAKTEFETICKTVAPPPIDPFIAIKNEMAQYLALRQSEFQAILKLAGMSYPQSEAQWNELFKRSAAREVKFEDEMAECHSDADWIAFGNNHGFSGTVDQIKQEAQDRLDAFQGVKGYRAAISLFTNVLGEINTLEQQKAPLSALQDWAKGISLDPSLSAQDRAEFQLLI